MCSLFSRRSLTPGETTLTQAENMDGSSTKISSCSPLFWGWRYCKVKVVRCVCDDVVACGKRRVFSLDFSSFPARRPAVSRFFLDMRNSFQIQWVHDEHLT